MEPSQTAYGISDESTRIFRKREPRSEPSTRVSKRRMPYSLPRPCIKALIYFVTNDKALERFEGLEVLVLDDFLSP